MVGARRKRSPEGLAAGVELRREQLPGSSTFWSWAGTEVTRPEDITQEHRKMTCGFSARNKPRICPNSYLFSDSKKGVPRQRTEDTLVAEEDKDDVIVISDDDEPQCSKKDCKSNPFCLNYLGQKKWENNEAKNIFMKAADMGDNPTLDAREDGTPVGLKNLGATCYANSSLQVWFRDLAFRNGVYQCVPSTELELKESPIFQLQVTFTALQESSQSVFNPVKLVKSLRLQQDAQQDAQEFSKLFMSLLDKEFQKQSIPSVRSLVRDQFQGKQVYGTKCNLCGFTSERDSDFLEIEVNFQNNQKLEECLSKSLEPETLSGDNKYFCQSCQSLQDATRYNELRELPPALHFSLGRFVFDYKTFSRKKSKDAILFPKTIDMGEFVNTASSEPPSQTNQIYDLRGILLHKGASAYHGHYEAQIFDSEHNSWFQFNDELVTRIDKLGDKRPARMAAQASADDDEKPLANTNGQHRSRARKRRRIEDSDDECAKKEPPEPPKENEYVLSKDAYMLVYSKRGTEPATNGHASKDIAVTFSSQPPSNASDVIQELNAAHEAECEAYDRKKTRAEEAYADTRRKVMDIYRSWAVDNLDDCVVVSKQALERWFEEAAVLSAHASLPRDEKSSNMKDPANNDMDVDGSTATIFSLNHILCDEHYCLDFHKASDMKCISASAYELMKTTTNSVFSKKIRPRDVCEQCVQKSFNERLYWRDHPRLVEKFNKVCDVPEGGHGYWISKVWLKDWKLLKPRMHIEGEADPHPEFSEFKEHVRCPHEQLTNATVNRRKISPEGCEILLELFPDWVPFASDSETCPICEVEIDTSKELKKQARKLVEDEKAILKYVYDNDAGELKDHPCAMVPTSFLRDWRCWISKNGDAPKPQAVDNSPFICEHGKLSVELNFSSDRESATVVRKEDYDSLAKLYKSCGPFIGVKKHQKSYEKSTAEPIYEPELEVCTDCLHKRWTQWDTNEIKIRLKIAVTNGIRTSAANGVRQSSRLQQRKKEFKMTVTKRTTVMDIKKQTQTHLQIPTLCQTLLLRGRALDDNEEVVGESLHLNDVVELREVKEVVEISDTEDEEPPKGRKEGEAFGNTLLGMGM